MEELNTLIEEITNVIYEENDKKLNICNKVMCNETEYLGEKIAKRLVELGYKKETKKSLSEFVIKYRWYKNGYEQVEERTIEADNVKEALFKVEEECCKEKKEFNLISLNAVE